MAARPWVTPEEVIQYTSHEDVLKRPVEKLAFDISRAELKVIAKTNNSFGEEYPEIPESVSEHIAIIHSYLCCVINSDNKMITLAYTGRIIWTNQRIKRKANTIANNL